MIASGLDDATPSLRSARWRRLASCPVPHHGNEAADEAAALAGIAHDARFIEAYHLSADVEILIGRFSQEGSVTWASAHEGLPETGLFRSGSETNDGDRGELMGLVSSLEWHGVPLGLHDTKTPDDVWAADLEDLLLNAERGSVAWYLHASPVRLRPQEGEEAEVLKGLRRIVRDESAGTIMDRLAAERAARLIEFLQVSEPAGIWHATLWAGAPTELEARALAGQLLASSGVRRLAVVLIDSAETPGLVPTCVLGALGRSPVVEVPGVRIRRSPRWDMTPERGGPIRIGRVASPTSAARGGPVSATPDTINRHVFVTGATGSGKSQTVRRILEQLTANGTPWLVIEPAKAEYHTLAETIPAPISLIKLGGEQGVPLSLNPLEPTSLPRAEGESGEARTFNLATHIALVRGLFEASFEVQEPFPQILAAALDRAYQAYGWDTASGRRRGVKTARAAYPTLDNVRRHALAVVDEMGYGREVRDNVRGFVEVRINGLRNGAAGRFFETGHPIDLAAMARSNVILQIEDLGNERDQAFLMGSVLIRWIELLRMLGDSEGLLRHVMVIEEAHRLLRAADDSRASAIEQFANMLAEVRSYGQGLIIAEQIPSKLIPDAIKNSALKVVHRLPAQDDRDAVGATMNLDAAQSEAVVALAPGHAVLHSDGMDYPIPVAVDPPTPAAAGSPLAPLTTLARSPACSYACRGGDRCSADELETSSRAADDHALAAWVELATVARLLGQPLPSISPGHVARWRKTASGVGRLRCALGIAADRSVRTRLTHMIDFFEPSDLALNLAETLFAMVDDARPDSGADTGPDVRFQAAELRWRDVTLALMRAVGGPDAARPHPDTEAWRNRGLSLVGATVHEQLEELQAVQQANATSRRGKLWGDPSILREVVQASASGSTSELADWLGTGSQWIADWFKE